MKTLNCLILLTFLAYGVRGQNENDIIKEIRKQYNSIYNDLLSKSYHVKLGYQIGGGKLHLVEDELADLNFDCALDICQNFYTLCFVRNETDGKWELIKLTHQSSFADGFDAWIMKTNYYFKNQNLFFVYSVNTNNYSGDDQEYDIEITRTENRFYYSEGKIIKHLFKRKSAPSDYGLENQAKSSLKELMRHIPSKENPHINPKKFNPTWVNNLIEDWGHGAKKIK